LDSSTFDNADEDTRYLKRQDDDPSKTRANRRAQFSSGGDELLSSLMAIETLPSPPGVSAGSRLIAPVDS